ncbi:MAG TPA: SDR family NAD(P)-dependent oxidoreductase, partial [Bacteroidia bacterium]|nr:SDR family NAD(P)-dependent oxidoreductase [Bacteroidia bacterium]
MSIILITGSNKGIGFETARQLGTKGHHVFISGRNEQRLNEALQKLLKENITADALLMDVSDPESIALAAELFAKQKLKLDVLINNAGIGVRNDRMISSDDEAVLGEVINTNAYGPLRVTKAFLPFMNSPARIINIS